MLSFKNVMNLCLKERSLSTYCFTVSQFESDNIINIDHDILYSQASFSLLVTALNLACHTCHRADVATQIAYSLLYAWSFNVYRHFRLTGQQRIPDIELKDAIHSIRYGIWPAVDGTTHHECASQKSRMPTALFPATVASDENLANVRSWVHGDVSSFSGGLRGASICSTNARADEHNLALLDIEHGEEKATKYFGCDEVVRVRDGDQLF
jgi:hypothetical protein